MEKMKFPQIRKKIEDFLFDEEGNIPRNKMLTIGAMVLLLTVFYSSESFAKHRSHSAHSSHSAHRSHSSHTSHASGTHTSHASSSHTSHGSSIHSNTSPVHSSHSSHASAAHSSSYNKLLSSHQNSFSEIQSNNIDIGAERATVLQESDFPIQTVDNLRLPGETQPNSFLNDVEIVPAAAAFAKQDATEH